MIIPVRCTGCGKPVAQFWEGFKTRVQKGEDRGKVMDSLGLERYCCRALFLGHVDLLEKAAAYKKA